MGLPTGLSRPLSPGTENNGGVSKLETSEISKAYRGRRVVDDVTVHLQQGEVVGLLGQNGAGKTTTFYMIVGLITPDSGRILLDDVILFDAESRVHVPPRRRNIGCVFQRDSLFPHLTLRQNLMFAAKRFPRLDRHRRVAEMLDRFHLAGAAASRPRDVTPAERLRGEVARALIGEPKLLLLDGRAIGEALLREIRLVPILLVTHDLDLMYKVADRVVFLFDGGVIFFGPTDELEKSDHPHIREFLELDRVVRA